MNAVVIYKSKTGYTKKYAEWIAKELKADLFDVSTVEISTLSDYDTVIYGGSLHAVGIDGIKFIKRNFDRLKGKKIIVFATGTSPFRENVTDEVTEKNFTPEQREQIRFFYFRGGFNYAKLPPFDKFLMSLLKMKIKIKEKKGGKLTPDEKGMLSIYDKPVDYTRKEKINDLIAYARM